MRKSRFTEEQIIEILNEQESSKTISGGFVTNSKGSLGWSERRTRSTASRHRAASGARSPIADPGERGKAGRFASTPVRRTHTLRPGQT
jgi:hypothetical protein